VRIFPTSILVVLILVVAAEVFVGVTGRAAFAVDRFTGQPLAIVDLVPGPATGPECPLDQRYVDEKPDGLRPDVLAAFQRLRAAAQAQDVRMCVNDGKRSRAQQQHEFDEAVKKFGNAELAARYVLSPDKSNHVKGIAVDIQPLSSAAWVEENGRPLGWCRRYDNEKWHFEYDPNYVSAGCPALLPSATGS
jgi:D-alanyl-D-alanine carboxypeptidase